MGDIWPPSYPDPDELRQRPCRNTVPHEKAESPALRARVSRGDEPFWVPWTRFSTACFGNYGQRRHVTAAADHATRYAPVSSHEPVVERLPPFSAFTSACSKTSRRWSEEEPEYVGHPTSIWSTINHRVADYRMSSA